MSAKDDLSARLKRAIARRSPDTLRPYAKKLKDRSSRWKERQQSPSPPPEAVWCLVANVAEYQPHGEDHEIRRGTKHFSPNTKVYCYPGLWGDGYENIKVIGRHRGSRRLVTLIMPRWRLTNWRAKLVRHPHVVATLSPRWTEARAHDMAAWLVFDETAMKAKRTGFETVRPEDALLFASRFGLVADMARALARGATLDVRRGHLTPLWLAIEHHHLEAVRWLVAQGVDVTAPCGSFDTAIAMARVIWHAEPSILAALGVVDEPIGRWRTLWRRFTEVVRPARQPGEPSHGDRP